jgi:hypothetical protein
LAAAYPHLTREQQQGVVKYVRAELASAARAPWCTKGHLPPDQGARRELHAFNEAWGWERYWGMWGRHRPILGGFYGLWLYADRTGDWDTIKKHYGEIAAFYRARVDQADLYGTMGAHVAMARIARLQKDADTAGRARANAAAAFELGKSFAEIEKCTQKYYKDRYAKRQLRGTYLGWMFLDLSPEVGRYLADNVKDAVLKRHEVGLRRYPLFWLREVPYNSRWTGDEGLGIPTELMGMIVPIDRWVAGAGKQKLVSCTRSAPICIGDCHWIEMLVDAIESFGTTRWVKTDLGSPQGNSEHKDRDTQEDACNE